MKRATLFTIIWMFGLTAVVFGIWVGVLVPLAHTHRHLFAMMYLDGIFQSVFFVTPLMAWWLGWRGKLPGTKRQGKTNAT